MVLGLMFDTFQVGGTTRAFSTHQISSVETLRTLFLMMEAKIQTRAGRKLKSGMEFTRALEYFAEKIKEQLQASVLGGVPEHFGINPPPWKQSSEPYWIHSVSTLIQFLKNALGGVLLVVFVVEMYVWAPMSLCSFHAGSPQCLIDLE